MTTAETILAMERAAFERWSQGDTDGFLEISAPDVSYFDPFVERRLDSLDCLRPLYDSIRGTFKVDRYEIIEPRVQVAGDCAVLTFRFESESAGTIHRWNTTEVYRNTAEGWRIIHTHWALHQPK